MLTETPNPRSENIDRRPTLDILEVINDEDATVAQAVRCALPAIARGVDIIVDCLRAGGRLIYVGSGTSGRLGVLDAVECVPTFSVPPHMVQGVIAGGARALTDAVEGAEDDPYGGRAAIEALAVTTNDVVVGIAASGRTPFVLGAVDAARERGAATLGISCNEPAPLLERVDVPIAAIVGPEVIAGSTRLKAGTAQKLILNMLSTASMIRLGKVYGNLMVDVKVTNRKLAARARRIVAEVTGLSEDQAAELLATTNYEVKPAIVMAQLGVTPEEARRRLSAADGVLAAVLHPPAADS